MSQTASNPVSGTGVSNVLLQPQQGGTNPQQAGVQGQPAQPGVPQAAPQQDMGLQPKEILQALDKVAACPLNDLKKYSYLIEDLFNRSQDAHIQEQLGYIQNAITMANDPKKQTIDPLTEKRDPTAPELARDLAREIRDMQNTQKTSATVYNYSREAAKGKAPVPAPPEKKKKSRGNPFRVLMGKVGKLLDHGLDKHDIVRYIAKEKKWNEDTIGKAVDIVRDYSKKKRRTEKKFENADEGSKIKKAAVSTFNWNRYSAKAEDTSIYEIKPDFVKRSTAELMARSTWLKDLQSYGPTTPQGDSRKAASKEGVAAELKSIRAALTARGFELNELF